MPPPPSITLSPTSPLVDPTRSTDIQPTPTTTFYEHPDPERTVLPHLLPHLPRSTTQLYLTRAHLPGTVLASFPPTSPPTPEETWSTARLDLARPGDTQCWFWCSLEASLDTRHNASPDASTADIPIPTWSLASTHLTSFLIHIANTHPALPALLLGSLSRALFARLPPSQITYSSSWAKMVFSSAALTPADARLREAYAFRPLDEDDFEAVERTSTVKRTRETLRRSSNTGAYLLSPPPPAAVATDRVPASAWCFLSREGSISTLYVAPPSRGHGLGKATMRHQLLEAFRDRPYTTAEVSTSNGASLALCRSMGARRDEGWDVVWAGVSLDAYRGA
ncbi:hypothetical protein OF83DRAFT_1062701 [Amylostereum chailletii]|nr:hypothetical protein OF83DRAFT_1062701 [Amylostereum chailletii]